MGETFEVVRVDDGHGDYFTAAVLLGGVPWTARAAERCVPVVERAWSSMAVDETRQVEPGLIEISYHHAKSTRAGSITRRLRERPDWVRVETSGQTGPDRGTVPT